MKACVNIGGILTESFKIKKKKKLLSRELFLEQYFLYTSLLSLQMHLRIATMELICNIEQLIKHSKPGDLLLKQRLSLL